MSAFFREKYRKQSAFVDNIFPWVHYLKLDSNSVARMEASYVPWLQNVDIFTIPYLFWEIKYGKFSYPSRRDFLALLLILMLDNAQELIVFWRQEITTTVAAPLIHLPSSIIVVDKVFLKKWHENLVMLFGAGHTYLLFCKASSNF